MSWATMRARWATPMRMTIVPPTLASERQSTSSSPVRRWPVATVTAADRPRCVTGTPAAAGAATEDVMPGTTSTSTPASLSANASSPPRPKTNGSPPFNRTTFRPCRPSSTRSALIISWGTGRPGRLPTSISSADAGIRSSTPSPTSASWTTTSAASMRRTARNVSSSGSPGPAPTNATVTTAHRRLACGGRCRVRGGAQPASPSPR